MKRVIALAGRPNTGKTTLFNALTGMRQKVANFAGCTVEKAVGELEVAGEDVEIVDLPGTHSLLPDTEDEKVAFRFLSECADAGADLLVLCVGEASNLSNCLALAAGLKAAGYPVALVINMIDEARLNGVTTWTPRLSGFPTRSASPSLRPRRGSAKASTACCGSCVRGRCARTSRTRSIFATLPSAGSRSFRRPGSPRPTAPAPRE